MKKNILILLNASEEGFHEAIASLSADGEVAQMHLDNSVFKRIEDFELVKKFFSNNKNAVDRRIKLSYGAKLKDQKRKIMALKNRNQPLTLGKKRFDSEKELIHYIKAIVNSNENGKALDKGTTIFLKGKVSKFRTSKISSGG